MAASTTDQVTVGENTILEVNGLSKYFGPVRAVDDISFSVQRGEIVGFLGPNGAGKTTAMRMLVGYLIPTAGSVSLAGGNIFRDGARIKRQLGYLPENVPLYTEMTVGEYLQLMAQMKGLRGGEAKAAVQRAVSMLELDSMLTRQTGQLSRGYRQRVGLAQCLIADPSLLILDEPTTGLDPNQISELRRLMKSWRGKKAILLSTHILAEAMMLCDRVLIISKGRLVASGSPQSLAGRGDEAAQTTITVRGGAANPLAGFSGESGLNAVAQHDLWQIEGHLDTELRVSLAAHLAANRWEILEWNSGLSALEQTFRRLTLEEGDQRQDLM
jgi:gliding motility-associated transport system ATP-binding protein